MSVEDVVDGLRTVLARTEGLDLWPPWDAAETLVDLVAEARRVATEPPGPDPATARDAADDWHLAGADLDRCHDELATARERMTTEIWEGGSGDAFRRSLDALADRLATAPRAAHGVESWLRITAGELEKARSRHREAFDGLAAHLSIAWSDLTPWGLRDLLSGIVVEVAHGVRELLGAYEDAAEAHAVCRRRVVAAMDEIRLPDHLPHVPSTIAALNAWDDDGLLGGSVLRRYDDALAALSPEQRQRLLDELARTDDPTRLGLLMGAVAGGLSGAALDRYLRHLRSLDDGDLPDPDSFRGSEAQQPDQTTCGSTALVMARMRNDPAYALWVLTGYDPGTGTTDPRTPDERFAEEALRMHERTNALHDRDGDLQLPWPEALGTTPAAVAAEMSAGGGSGVPGTDYHAHAVDPRHPGRAFDGLVAAVEDGHSVPVFVGDGTLPRHVVLVTGASGDTVTVYDPAAGRDLQVSRDDWVSGDLGVAGWDEPWFTVVP